MRFTTGLSIYSVLFILAISSGLYGLEIRSQCMSSWCIRKCCPEDQVWDFVKGTCGKTPLDQRNFIKDFFNQTFTEDPSVIIGNLCPAESEMIAQGNHPHVEDILLNGDVVISGRTLSIDDYCIDYVNSDGILGKVLFICSFRRSLDQMKSAEDNEADKIPLSKCCPEANPHYFYSPLSKGCSQLNSTRKNWPPPVTSANGNQILNLPESEFRITYSHTPCPSGFIIESSTEFTLYDDGSVSIPGLDNRLSAGSFCIDALDDAHYSNPDNRPNAIEYCVPDVCRPGIACVKKCCPLGHIYSTSSGQPCVPDAQPLNIEFRTPQNVSVPVELVPHTIRNGSMPNCQGRGMNLLNPFDYPDEKFHLLPTSGNLYIPGYPQDREKEEYCIENFELEGSILPLAFICFPPEPTHPPGFETALAIYPYFMSISTIFLILTFLVYAMLPELQNLHGQSIMCYVFSLTVTFVGLTIIQTGSANNYTGFCKSTAITVHFFFLATFMWLNVMGFDLWSTFSKRFPDEKAIQFWLGYIIPRKRIPSFELILRNKAISFTSTSSQKDIDDDTISPLNSPSDNPSPGSMRPMSTSSNKKITRFIYYSCFAWGIPLVIVIIGQILDNVPTLPDGIIKPQFGVFKCWFHDSIALLCYLYGPVGASIMANITFFIMTAIKLYNASREASFATQQKGRKERFRIIMYLFVLMGVFWILEIISFAAQGSSAYIWIFFDLLNILTGLFIFVIFVCKRQVILLLRKRYSFFNKGWKLACKNHPKWDRTTDPEVRSSHANTTSTNRATSTDAKRKISTTSVTQVCVRDSDLSDRETSHLNTKVN